jgi:hypothetical protein
MPIQPRDDLIHEFVVGSELPETLGMWTRGTSCRTTVPRSGPRLVYSGRGLMKKIALIAVVVGLCTSVSVG